MRLMACLLAVGALAIAGCGSSNKSSGGSGGSAATSTPSPSSASSSGGGKSVPVAADPSGAPSFTTKTLKAKSGTVTFTFTNKSSVPHAIAVEGHGVNTKGKVVTGGSDTLSVKLKPGKYTFYCPVDGHRAAGMVGTLTVS